LRTGQLETGGPASFGIESAECTQIAGNDEIPTSFASFGRQLRERDFRCLDAADVGFDDLRVAGLSGGGG
jgi:hypothetical protein